MVTTRSRRRRSRRCRRYLLLGSSLLSVKRVRGRCRSRRGRYERRVRLRRREGRWGKAWAAAWREGCWESPRTRRRERLRRKTRWRRSSVRRRGRYWCQRTSTLAFTTGWLSSWVFPGGEGRYGQEGEGREG